MPCHWLSLTLSWIYILVIIDNVPLTFQCAIQKLHACPNSSSYLLACLIVLGILQGPMDGACNHVGHGCEHIQKRSELHWIVRAYSFAIKIGGGVGSIGALGSHRGHHIRLIHNDSLQFGFPVPQCSFNFCQGGPIRKAFHDLGLFL